MSSLLAILLVVNSTRGHHYVFSYPPDPQRPSAPGALAEFSVAHSTAKANMSRGELDDPASSTSLATTAAASSTTSTTATTNANINVTATTTSTLTSEPNDTRLSPNTKQPKGSELNEQDLTHDAFAGRDAIFNLDVAFLADALAPKLPLCDRKFQLSIDDLVMVGHPVSLTDAAPERAAGDILPVDDTHDATSHPSPISPTAPGTPTSAQQQQNPQQQLQPQDSPSGTPSTLSPPPSAIRRQSSVLPKTEGGHTDKEDDRSRFDRSTHMTLFHVVFVLSPPDLELDAQVEGIYKHVVRRYTAALRYEQLRCGYVQDEIEKVLALKEEAFNKGTPYTDVMQEILRVSSLARDIKHVYRAISSNQAAHVIINDFIDLSLQVPLLGGPPSLPAPGLESGPSSRVRDPNLGSLMDIYGTAGYEYEGYPVLCPYHTLLLLEDPEEVLKNMPLDASPTLVQLVQILTPTQSLQELHLLLDCSLAQIYRLAAHLIYWRKAKLIHTIHARNIYVVSPHAKLDDLSHLDADFRHYIPGLDLPTLLSQLSIAKPLHMITPSKDLRNQYLEAITYLVRKDLVLQIHMFLVLILPPSVRGSCAESDAHSEMSATSLEQPFQDSPPPAGALGDPAWQRLHKLAHEKAPKEVADLFEQLTPYMNGKHPVEEIMYREGVSRKQLSLVLKYYREHIVTVYHH